VGTDWPHGGERREQARKIVGLMLDQVNELSLMGSPALGLCNVAAGRLHAYCTLNLKIGDIAAASLILERAGGVLTDADGNSWLYSDGGYIATNTVIHGWLLKLIQAVLHFRPSQSGSASCRERLICAISTGLDCAAHAYTPPPRSLHHRRGRKADKET